MEKEQKLLCKCLEIFGTDDPEQWKKIMKKAKKYDDLMRGVRPANPRGAGRKGLKEEKADTIRRMSRKGVSVARIARDLSVSRPTVYRYVEEIRRWERHPSVQMQLEYMYKDRVCTVIDVDWKNQTVYVENRTNQLPLTAFGVNKTPGWEEFREFLEDRCVPGTRFHLKELLRDMGVDFYDPMLIIEETKGRMAEDDQWIRIHYREDALCQNG